MNPKVMWLIGATMTASAVITLVGCSDGDGAARQELVDFARQMVAEQQAASRSLQSQSTQLSTAAKELVASDAAAQAPQGTQPRESSWRDKLPGGAASAARTASATAPT